MVSTHPAPSPERAPTGDPLAERGIPVIQKLVAVFWPSFVTAGIATILFFTAFDPEDLFAELGLGRMAIYSIGFFCFWALTASSCALSLFFMKPCVILHRRGPGTPPPPPPASIPLTIVNAPMGLNA
jgi:hypothetical protein